HATRARGWRSSSGIFTIWSDKDNLEDWLKGKGLRKRLFYGVGFARTTGQGMNRNGRTQFAPTQRKRIFPQPKEHSYNATNAYNAKENSPRAPSCTRGIP
ncbi:MAG: hypothetical protein E6123_09425, partial [Clostridiales bacterium]|nr:hypothetical protein [Clostridiales bacterium]